jgi:demethoxyubiquinone hydroxylase (CLK1/Coq7/Cat5 family)
MIDTPVTLGDRLDGLVVGETCMALQPVVGKPRFDISIIRPEMRAEHCKLRGQGYPAPRLRAIRKGLRTLHTLELMAQTIYKFQITRERSDLNCQLLTAMCNEMGHYQDDQVKLYEYGFRPSILRPAYWLVGALVGFGSRILGTKAILRTGIWVESKAVHHYAELLETIEWDDQTRRMIEKDQADEDGHIARWTRLLQAGTPVPVQA